jgi:hypothetical protein
VDRAACLTFEMQPGNDNFGPIRLIAVVMLLWAILLRMEFVIFFFYFLPQLIVWLVFTHKVRLLGREIG